MNFTIHLTHTIVGIIVSVSSLMPHQRGDCSSIVSRLIHWRATIVHMRRIDGDLIIISLALSLHRSDFSISSHSPCHMSSSYFVNEQCAKKRDLRDVLYTCWPHVIALPSPSHSLLLVLRERERKAVFSYWLKLIHQSATIAIFRWQLTCPIKVAVSLLTFTRSCIMSIVFEMRCHDADKRLSR